jgi:hypothetical protein
LTIEYSPRPSDSAQLVLRIREQRANLEALVHSLSDAELLAPLGDWSVKDHLAHLAAWQGKALAALQGRPAHEGLGLAEPPADVLDFDAINVVLHERWKGRSLDEALAAYRRHNVAIVAALENVDFAALLKPYEPDDPDGRRVLDIVAANTYEHALEHQVWINRDLQERLR